MKVERVKILGGKIFMCTEEREGERERGFDFVMPSDRKIQ